MSVAVREISVKSVLTKSGIPGTDYCINPYVGCVHGCVYCYAVFMKRFTGHSGAWGTFIDVKINAPKVLQEQLKKTKQGSVIISSVTDAYQSIEAKYKVTRQCLEVLLLSKLSVVMLTKSPLVLRDLDLIKRFDDIEVGITVTTDTDRIQKLFEPGASSFEARVNTLKKLHAQGVKTYAFIGPVLPMNPENLARRIFPHVDYVLVDKMNYVSKTRGKFRSLNLSQWLEPDFTNDIVRRLKKSFSGKDVNIC